MSLLPPSPPSQPLLVLERDSEDALEAPLAHGRAALWSCRAPDKQGPNEDGGLLVELAGERLVLAVADGLGGRPGGAAAARVALETFSFALRDADGLVPLREALLAAFDRANQAVLERAGGGATTLVVAAIEGGAVRTYHVGDSCALIVGGRGKQKHLTVAHSPTGWGVEAGLLREREAMRHEERHLVSNVLGASDMRVELSSALPLAARDTVLCASDGLFDNLRVPEIAAQLAGGSLNAVLERLARRARARMQAALEAEAAGAEARAGAPDDLTLLAWRAR